MDVAGLEERGFLSPTLVCSPLVGKLDSESACGGLMVNARSGRWCYICDACHNNTPTLLAVSFCERLPAFRLETPVLRQMGRRGTCYGI